MAKRTNTSIKKVKGVDPEFLAQYMEDDQSLDALKQHREVPRLKIIQPTTDRKLKEFFSEGSVIIRPGDVLACVHDGVFSVVPLFFCVEYCKWSDIRSDTNIPIVERTWDPSSPLARKATDPEKRFETYEGQSGLDPDKQHKWRYVEHLRFISVFYADHELRGTPITISFERGEHRQGKNFISAISLRRQSIQGNPRPIPLWAQVWTMNPSFREPDQSRKWWGLNFKAAESPLIDPNDAEGMRTLHLEFKKAFEANLLTIQDEHGDKEAAEPTTDM